MCASPDFAEKHGRPQKPRDLLQFPAIVDTNWKGRTTELLVDDDGKEVTVSVNSLFEVNSPEVAKRAALAGLGVTMAPYFSVERELKSGALVSLLENRIPAGGGIYAVYPHRRTCRPKCACSSISWPAGSAKTASTEP